MTEPENRRCAVVTGSTRGIGRAVARELAAAGMNVVVNSSSERSLPAAEAVAAEIAEEFGVETLAVAANVAIEEEANALIAAAAEANGRVDVLVNNAGITRDGLAARMSDDDFDAVIDINLKGTFHCCRAAAKLMMKQRWGRIVNMSSVVGVYGNAGQVNYAASKAGVIGLTKSLARGAEPIAEITGIGSTGDAYHMTAPDPEATAITAAMAAALAEGGFTPADLGHLNAHGTGTPANDATESKALANLMGGVEAAASVPVTSVKGTTGHMLGAAGAVEAIVCALSVARDAVPPTAGFAEAAEDCPVAVVTEAVTDYPQKVALSTSLGFGGHNAALAFSPYNG